MAKVARARIISYNEATHCAALLLLANPQVRLEGVPVVRGLTGLAPGDHALALVWPEASALVLALWDESEAGA